MDEIWGSNMADYEWREACRRALRESDRKEQEIELQIAQAVQALHGRLDELGLELDGVAPERLAIFEAFRELDALRRKLKAKTGATQTV